VSLESVVPPEVTLPVDAPPRLLLDELQPANASTPANSGITKIFLFINTSWLHCHPRK
jgi:hypothetical protein